MGCAVWKRLKLILSLSTRTQLESFAVSLFACPETVVPWPYVV